MGYFVSGEVLAGVNECSRSIVATGRRQFLYKDFKFDGSTKVKVAFVDADDTIRRTKSKSPTPNTIDDVEILTDIVPNLTKLQENGYLLAIVSNQGGVPQFLSLENADLIMRYTIDQFAKLGVRFHYYDFATSKGTARKPGIGMAKVLEQVISSEFGVDAAIDYSKSMMIGDAGYTKNQLWPDGKTQGTDFSDSDRGFAEALAIPFIHRQVFVRMNLFE